MLLVLPPLCGRRVTPDPLPMPASDGSRRRNTSCQWRAARPSVRGVGGPLSVAGHPGGTSVSLAIPWYAAISVGPIATHSRGRVPGAMCRLRQIYGRQGVRGLAQKQGSWAIRQVHAPGEHEVNDVRIPAAFKWSRRGPHLVVVAAFQHHHGKAVGDVSWRRLRVCPRPHRLRVALCHCLMVVAPLPGCPAFEVCEALVWRDVEGVGAQLRRGLRLASGVRRRSGFVRRRDEHV